LTNRLLLALAAAWPLALLLTQPGAPLLAQTAAPSQTEFFDKSVKPVLAESCLGCHSAGAMGGLRLDSREGMLKGGKTGPAIVPGDPDKSLLITAVRHSTPLKMPLGGDRLTDAKIADLATWVRSGAPWPAAEEGKKPDSVLAEHFETHIRPVLAQQCFACHSAQKSGGLRLDSREDILAGGKDGAVLIPGDPDRSMLIAALKHSGNLKMPKGGTRLTDEQINFFVTWVKDGAFWPADTAPVKTFTEAQKNLWSV
jgi:mono/diheme cytochrome c family protein